MNKKISNKIILYYSLLIIFLVIFLLIFVNDLVRDTHLNVIKREMTEKLNFIGLVVRTELHGELHKKRLKAFVDRSSEIINLRLTVVDAEGAVLADSDVEDVSGLDNHLYRVEINRSLRNGTGESVRYSNTLETDMLYSARFIDPYVFRVAKPLCEIDENLYALKKIIVFLGFFVVIASVVITIYISNKLTRPINETLNFAKQFSHGDYTKRILNYSDDEIGVLQRSLNRMADTVVEKIESLLFEQKKLQVTIESITDGITVIDNEKRVLIANRSFIDLFEIDTLTTNRVYYEVIRSRSLNSKIEYALSTGEPVRFEEEFFNGSFLDVSIKPIKEERTLQGILVVLHDITEKKKIEQIKTDLVSNMSHELKTPVAIIKGYLETIEENIDNIDLCRDFIKKAISNADRQNAIINDILKLNLLETTWDFLVEQISVQEIIQNCIELLKPKTLSKKIKIHCDIDNIKDFTKGNRFLAEEIFFNIIDNAINYNNEEGVVSITAEQSEKGCMVSVNDTGIGIPKEALDRIFERFYRVDKSRSRDTGGTGLGLSIVKHAVEMLNWEIDVSSGKNGTSFRILF